MSETHHDPVTDLPDGGGPDAPRAVIVHGYNGYPAKHWFPWLASELVGEGFPVTRVALPEPTRPDPGAWAAALAEQERKQAEEDAKTVSYTHLRAHET